MTYPKEQIERFRNSLTKEEGEALLQRIEETRREGLDFLKSPSEFVDFFFKRNGLKVSPKGQLVALKLRHVEAQLVLDYAQAYRLSQSYNLDFPKFSKFELMAALTLRIEQGRKETMHYINSPYLLFPWMKSIDWPDEPAYRLFVPVRLLYISYKKWCFEHQHEPLRCNEFGKRMVEFGYRKSCRKYENKTTVRGYYVPSNPFPSVCHLKDIRKLEQLLNNRYNPDCLTKKGEENERDEDLQKMLG